MKRLLIAALALVAVFSLAGCRLAPNSPGFLPDGSSLWFLDVDRDTDSDGVNDTTVRMWAYWCHAEEQPQPCGDKRIWAWGDLWSTPIQP